MKVLCRLVLAALVACAWTAGDVCVRGQSVIVKIPLREKELPVLLREVETIVSAQNFAEALLYFDEIIERFRDLPEEEAKKGMAKAKFFRARCLLELDKAAEAVEAFSQYLLEYGAGDDRRDAYFFLADANARTENWEQVLVTVDRVLVEFPSLPENLRLIATQMKGDALYRLQRWQDAVDPLIFVFQKSKDEQVRTMSASMALGALMQAGMLDKVFEAVSIFYRTNVRYDMTMNIAMMEAGDKYADQGDYIRAVALYRLTHTKDELVTYLDNRIKQVKAEIERLKKAGGPRPTQAVLAQISMYRRSIPVMEEQLKTLQETKPWDKELAQRVGMTYTELGRHWEALILNRMLYDQDPEHEDAHFLLYSAFRAAVELREMDRAMVEGNEYIEKFPTKDYWNSVVMMLAGTFFEQEKWDKVIEMSDMVETVKPGSVALDYLWLLEGTAHFYKEDFPKAFGAFNSCAELGDKSGFAKTAQYWRALTAMFMEKFEVSLKMFQEYLAKYGEEDEYYADGMFRVAMSYYGMEKIEESSAQLKTFIEKYPDHQLTPEALNMMGDILASEGRLDEAIATYQRAATVAVHQAEKTGEPVKMAFVDYAAIQQARTLELEGRYEEIAKLMQEYLDRWGEKGNFAEATYWLGTAKTKLKRLGEAYQHFLDSIVRFGNNKDLDSVDMILRDMISASNNPLHPEAFARIREKLYDEMTKALARKQTTLWLRLTTLFAETESDKTRREIMMKSIMRDENIKEGSSLVLDLMGREALAQGNKPFAEKVFRHFMAHHPDSELGVRAYSWFIDNHIAAGQFTEATKLLAEVTSRWGRSEAGGWATVRKADILRLTREYETAIEVYKEVLKAREWKGALWTEALYGMGLCRMDQGKWAEANILFERIYALYEAYTDWSAKAYLKSAECLEKLGHKDKAISCLQRMLSKRLFQNLPEAELARKELQRLGGTPP